MNRGQSIHDLIERTVLKILDRYGVLQGQWRLGVVTQVISPTKLKVKIDGGTQPQTVSCNPDITFAVGNNVWVIFINGNGRDKFVISKRAI